MPVNALRMLCLCFFTSALSGCIVGTVVDAATSVAVGTIKVGAAVVGGTVKVAAAGVRAASGDDDEKSDKDEQNTGDKSTENPPATP